MRTSQRGVDTSSRLSLVSIFILGLAACVPLPVYGNGVIESAILVHVQPAGSDPCGAASITHCSEIERSTTEEGFLEFDLFVYPASYEGADLPIHQLQATVTWPDPWEFVSFQMCNGGVGSLDPSGTEHAIAIEWPGCPILAENVFLAARVVLDVSGEGRFAFDPEWPIPIGIDCGPDEFTALAMGVHAEAGMTCEFTRHECASGERCTPSFDPPALELTVPAGWSGQGEVTVTAIGAGGPAFPCPLTVTGMAGWLTGALTELEWPDYLLTVTADATDLSDGTYESKIRVAAYSTLVARCLPITLIVTSSESVPDPEPPGQELRSWGQIKAEFRR